MKPWWRVVAVTYEQDDDGSWLPVVRHELYGPTRARAIEVFRAHMKSDRFLRDCVRGSRFAGRVTCRTKVTIGRWRLGR